MALLILAFTCSTPFKKSRITMPAVMPKTCDSGSSHRGDGLRLLKMPEALKQRLSVR